MSGTDQTSGPEFPKGPFDAIASPFLRYIQTETASGAVVLLAATVALAAANTRFGPAFEAIWTTNVGLHIGGATWDYPLRHWINEGLVTLFFFVVGLEIKRELALGELSAPRAAALPIAAALGGMLVPAGLYLLLASGPRTGAGWGVVMATDLAFVAGCLALLGARVPNSLRVFVLALAIIDDIGAMLIIAFGYSDGIQPWPLAGAALGLVVTVLLQWLGVRSVLAYWFMGVATWAALHESGVHPTIAGVAFGLLTPVTPWVEPGRLARFQEWARRAAPAELAADLAARPPSVRMKLARAARESISPEHRLEPALHPWSAFLVLPLFALANAGVPVSAARTFDPITIATVVGLSVGKPLGIFAFAWMAVALGLARKPADLGWPMMLAAGLLCGVGFTVALFIANLAFAGEALASAKLGILIASLVSGGLGLAALWALSRKPARVA